MIELNKMIVAQLKERDPMFPDVERGILVPTVSSNPLLVDNVIQIYIYIYMCNYCFAGDSGITG